MYGKDIKSFISGGSAGYGYRIIQSRFYAFVNIGAGVGVKKQYNATKEHEVNIIEDWYDPQSGNMVSDTMHFVTIIVDHDQPNVDLQWRASLGIEYRIKHLYFRAFTDFRGWFHKVAEMEFVFDQIYRFQEDTHVQPYHSHFHGHFTARAAYSGIGIGVGWYFNNPS